MTARPSSDLAVITKAKELCAYVMTVTQKSPKHFRYTFVSRLQNLSLGIVECLFRANEVYVVQGDSKALERRAQLQHDAITNCKLLAYLADLARLQGCILMKQYEQIARLCTDCQNMIGAWITSDKKRFLPE